ncbi:MAG: hypothetical protein EAY69_08110 [Cytophagales bacterium]|nr:MAG: hypothetical protein EAY69_08110 [Cytophagales bacterium]
MKNLLKESNFNVVGNRVEKLSVLSIIEKNGEEKPRFLGTTLSSVIRPLTINPMPVTQIEGYSYLDGMSHIAWQFPTANNAFKNIFSWFSKEQNDANLQVSFQDILHEYISVETLDKYMMHRESVLIKNDQLNEYQKRMIAGKIYMVTDILKSNRFYVDIYNVKNQQMNDIVGAVKQYTGAEIEVINEQKLSCKLKNDWNFGFKAAKIVGAKGYQDRWGQGEYHFSLIANEVFRGAENTLTDDLDLEEEPFFIEEE